MMRIGAAQTPSPARPGPNHRRHLADPR